MLPMLPWRAETVVSFHDPPHTVHGVHDSAEALLVLAMHASRDLDCLREGL